MARPLRLHPGTALVGLVVLAVLLRVPTLGQQSFWLDEYFTLKVVDDGLSGVLDGVRLSEATPPGYYFLTAVWTELFGHGEVALRALPALFGVLTVPILYLTARICGSERAGLIAGLLCAVSPLMVWYSQEARAYALLAVVSAVGFLFFMLALNRRDGHWIWAWALTSALAFTVHYFAFTIVVPEAVWLLIAMHGRRGRVAAGTGVIALAVAALLPLALDQDGRTSWIGAFDLGDRLLQVPQHFLVGLQSPSTAPPLLIVAGLVVVVLALIPRTERSTRVCAGTAAGIFAAGLALSLLAMAVGQDFLITRNLIALWPPFAVAIAVLLGASSSGRLGDAAAGVLVLLGAGFTLWIFLTPAAQRPDWAAVARALGDPSSARVIVAEDVGVDVLPLEFYLDDLAPVPAGRGVNAEQVVVITLRSTPDYGIGSCWWGILCGGRFPDAFEQRLPKSLALPDGLTLVERGTTERFVYRRFHGNPKVRLPPPDFSDPYLIEEVRPAD